MRNLKQESFLLVIQIQERTRMMLPAGPIIGSKQLIQWDTLAICSPKKAEKDESGAPAKSNSEFPRGEAWKQCRGKKKG